MDASTLKTLRLDQDRPTALYAAAGTSRRLSLIPGVASLNLRWHHHREYQIRPRRIVEALRDSQTALHRRMTGSPDITLRPLLLLPRLGLLFTRVEPRSSVSKVHLHRSRQICRHPTGRATLVLHRQQLRLVLVVPLLEVLQLVHLQARLLPPMPLPQDLPQQTRGKENRKTGSVLRLTAP
jgi:hypothetical protein